MICYRISSSVASSPQKRSHLQFVTVEPELGRIFTLQSGPLRYSDDSIDTVARLADLRRFYQNCEAGGGI